MWIGIILTFLVALVGYWIKDFNRVKDITYACVTVLFAADPTHGDDIVTYDFSLIDKEIVKVYVKDRSIKEPINEILYGQDVTIRGDGFVVWYPR